jgi:hypothetical protein
MPVRQPEEVQEMLHGPKLSRSPAKLRVALTILRGLRDPAAAVRRGPPPTPSGRACRQEIAGPKSRDGFDPEAEPTAALPA